MDIIEKIINSNDEEIDGIIDDEIKNEEIVSPKVEQLGFTSKNMFCFHKGFIPLKTRIKYSNYALETYSMETTDFIYSFGHFIKKYDIKDKASIIHYLEYFIDNYFGPYQNKSRESILNEVAWNSTTTDEEYFQALDNNKIGDLKGTGAAECTERTALSQQILSILGFDVYYCTGYYTDSKGRNEAHAFNITKNKNGYTILDYSLPIYSYKDNKLVARYPFIGKLSEEEFNLFINEGIIKTFDDYEYRDGKMVLLNKKRNYKAGKKKEEYKEK